MRISIRLFPLFLALFTPWLHAAHGGGAQVKIDEVETGRGLEVVSFSVVDVHYTGRLENGEVFDSSLERGEPFRFTVGAGQVIPGWEMGILGMQAGGKRILEIPPELAYGKQGAGGVIPPNARLTFEIELLRVRPPSFESIDNAALQEKLERGIKLIDIRRPEEWRQTGVIEGSIRVTAFDSRGQFISSFVETLARTVQPDEEFAVICLSGNRTAVLSNWLATQGGYAKVRNHRNGIAAWIAEGRPVDKH